MSADDFLRRTDDPWQERIDDAASAETPDWLDDDEPELLLIRLPQTTKEES